jgi:hypothetical protein
VLCSAADLQYIGQDAGAASGRLALSHTFRMVRASACRLDGAPVLTYFDGSGRATLDASHLGDSTWVAVGLGDEVGFTIQIVNGYGGYPTDAPECASITIYEQLAVALPDNSSVPLTGATDLAVQCVGGDGAPASVTNWESRD